MATTASQTREAFSRIVELPPRAMWAYALPGAPQLHELRWRLRLRRARVITAEEHAARVGVGPLEEVIGCSLCGERRLQPLFHPRGVAGATAADADAPARKSWEYEVVPSVSCAFLYATRASAPSCSASSTRATTAAS